jgi:hypothetical protein
MKIPISPPCSAFVLMVALHPLAAQSVAPRVREPAGPDAAERIPLSPFVVNASHDTGYQATSTLAGTRLVL